MLGIFFLILIVFLQTLNILFLVMTNIDREKNREGQSKGVEIKLHRSLPQSNIVKVKFLFLLA